MKSMTRSMLVVLAAALVLSGMASATASATACTKKAGSKKYALCVEGQNVSTAGFSSHIKVGTSATLVIESTEPIECQTVNGSGTFSPSSEASQMYIREFLFSNCELTGEFKSACTVKVSSAGASLTGKFGPSVENVILSSSQKPLWIVTIASKKPGSCPASLARQYDIRTSGVSGAGPECKFPEVQTELAEHQLTCEGAKSHLEWAGHMVTLNLEELTELTEAKKGQKFSIIESA